MVEVYGRARDGRVTIRAVEAAAALPPLAVIPCLTCREAGLDDRFVVIHVPTGTMLCTRIEDRGDHGNGVHFDEVDEAVAFVERLDPVDPFWTSFGEETLDLVRRTDSTNVVKDSALADEVVRRVDEALS
jgi:hypothetical protein